MEDSPSWSRTVLLLLDQKITRLTIKLPLIGFVNVCQDNEGLAWIANTPNVSILSYVPVAPGIASEEEAKQSCAILLQYLLRKMLAEADALRLL